MHVEIAAAAAVDHRNAAVPDADLAAALRALRNLHLVRLIERGDFDLRAQRRLRDVHRNGAVQILFAPLEEGVLA